MTNEGVTTLFVLLEHNPNLGTDHLIQSLPESVRTNGQVAWYDSGHGSDQMPAARLPVSRMLKYAKVTPFFFDTFEWFAEAENAQSFDSWMNLESDMLFTHPDPQARVRELMRNSDYVLPRYQSRVLTSSRWRPYRSLRQERSELLSILGTDYLSGGFCPGQIFSRAFVNAIIEAPFYPELREFIARNQGETKSFTLQEVLIPTLARILGVRIKEYGRPDIEFNRYRPYLGEQSYRRAIKSRALFVHPIRREPEDRARAAVGCDLSGPDDGSEFE